MDRPAAAAHRARAGSMVLEFDEGLGHARAVPAGGTGIAFPGVVVGRLAPAPDHAVDRRGPAQALAANPHLAAACAAFLARLGDRIGPHVLGLLDQLGDALGQRDPEAVVFSAGFEHQHARASIRAQSFGHDASGRARADNDVVPGFGHRSSPGTMAGMTWPNEHPSVLMSQNTAPGALKPRL